MRQRAIPEKRMKNNLGKEWWPKTVAALINPWKLFGPMIRLGFPVRKAENLGRMQMARVRATKNQWLRKATKVQPATGSCRVKTSKWLTSWDACHPRALQPWTTRQESWLLSAASQPHRKWTWIIMGLVERVRCSCYLGSPTHLTPNRTLSVDLFGCRFLAALSSEPPKSQAENLLLRLPGPSSKNENPARPGQSKKNALCCISWGKSSKVGASSFRSAKSLKSRPCMLYFEAGWQQTWLKSALLAKIYTLTPVSVSERLTKTPN